MNYISLSASVVVILLVILSSCNLDYGTDTHTHGDETHAPNDPELEPLAFTKWTKKSELFVEFPPLIVGHQSRFAAHFSDMVSFKAIEQGKSSCSINERQSKCSRKWCFIACFTRNI